MDQASELTSLKLTISSMQEAISRMEGQLSRLTHPLQRVFIVEPDLEDGGWTEQTANDGELVEFTGGRHHTEDFLEPETAVALIEYDDKVDGVRKKTYVKIGGGGSSGLVLCILTHTGSDQYTATNFQGTGEVLGTGLLPQSRLFGLDLTIVAHASYGCGYYVAGTFVLAIAFGERYSTAPCPVPVP